mgnify:FL=1
MANLSVEKLATIIGSAPEQLLSQMQEAGLSHTNLSDEVTDSDKKKLLNFLKNQQSKSKKTISLKTDSSKTEISQSGSVAIKRKKVTKENNTSLEEKSRKTSSSIDFDEIERKRVAGENQKKVDEDKRRKDSEQKTLITRRKAKSKESPTLSKDVKQLVKTKKPSKIQKVELSKQEKREILRRTRLPYPPSFWYRW